MYQIPQRVREPLHLEFEDSLKDALLQKIIDYYCKD